MQGELRKIVGSEAVEWPTDDEIMRELWRRVFPEEASHDDLWATVRQCARMETKAVSGTRLDRLRAAGNGVVPLQAAVALLALWRRAGLG